MLSITKYYYIFKEKSRKECISALSDSFSEISKKTRISNAQRIFRESREIEALRIIISSNKVDAETQERAKTILADEEKGR